MMYIIITLVFWSLYIFKHRDVTEFIERTKCFNSPKAKIITSVALLTVITIMPYEYAKWFVEACFLAMILLMLRS